MSQIIVKREGDVAKSTTSETITQCIALPAQSRRRGKQCNKQIYHRTWNL